jgi:hypothetical protein
MGFPAIQESEDRAAETLKNRTSSLTALRVDGKVPRKTDAQVG